MYALSSYELLSLDTIEANGYFAAVISGDSLLFVRLFPAV